METLTTDFGCSDCKFGSDGVCKIYGFDKPDNCTDFSLDEADLPTDEENYYY